MARKSKSCRKLKEPPDGGWGWIVVLGVSLVNLSTRPIEPSFGLLFGDTLEKLSIATTGAGFIVSTYEAVINFSGLFVGPLIKYFSVRKVAIFGAIMTGVGLISTSSAASMTHIISTYSILNGFGIGLSSSATFVALNHYFKKRRGQAVGLTMTGTGLGLLLMPQGVRYLTEEYGFAGSILILGGFALNSCVGASLLQPVKWHYKNKLIEQGSLLTEESRDKDTPAIKVTATEQTSKDDNDHDDVIDQIAAELKREEKQNLKPTLFKKAKDMKDNAATSGPRKYSLGPRQNSLYEPVASLGDIEMAKNGMNKSSTETKLDSYFRLNKVPRMSSGLLTNNRIGDLPEENRQTVFPKTRKSSTISNLSNLDFHGSGLHIHAIKHHIKSERAIKKSTEKSLWSRFSTFMDFDLLKDPVFLNITFGLSIFYVAELNFKMVVPFFLASLGHSKSETALCLSMMAASDIVARLVLPPICDRLTRISRRTFFMIATIFCAISRSALAETGEWIQLEVILVISGFFRGATLINFMLVISEYCEDKMEKLPAAFGLHMVAKGIFIVAFGPLIGLIRDKTNSFPLCIHAQSAFILLCSISWCTEYIIVRCRRTKET